ncbi:hypothetical protein JI739_01370 [Ramlibacter sp. AW1]|uniref:Uncharacterized protein n=1 Tax=Ramlibacter aurantiacus TaxID=2801330 RepID=A0A937D030_9BURK|nr:hypothetical protein [Ramlibacter aurantiacus]MBL0418984.1 hypothetical protein [Ramlibacter aurantiacus]
MRSLADSRSPAPRLRSWSAALVLVLVACTGGSGPDDDRLAIGDQNARAAAAEGLLAQKHIATLVGLADQLHAGIVAKQLAAGVPTPSWHVGRKATPLARSPWDFDGLEIPACATESHTHSTMGESRTVVFQSCALAPGAPRFEGTLQWERTGGPAGADVLLTLRAFSISDDNEAVHFDGALRFRLENSHVRASGHDIRVRRVHLRPGGPDQVTSFQALHLLFEAGQYQLEATVSREDPALPRAYTYGLSARVTLDGNRSSLRMTGSSAELVIVPEEHFVRLSLAAPGSDQLASLAPITPAQVHGLWEPRATALVITPANAQAAARSAADAIGLLPGQAVARFMDVALGTPLAGTEADGWRIGSCAGGGSLRIRGSTSGNRLQALRPGDQLTVEAIDCRGRVDGAAYAGVVEMTGRPGAGGRVELQFNLARFSEAGSESNGDVTLTTSALDQAETGMSTKTIFQSTGSSMTLTDYSAQAPADAAEGSIEVQATVETYDPALAAAPVRYEVRASIRGSLSAPAAGEISMRGDGMSLVQAINGSQRTLELKPGTGPGVAL